MEKFILALDQGTTSSRTILFDHLGWPRATRQEEFPQYYPEPGWVEHDPVEIWESQLRTVHAAISDAGIQPENIAAIGITNQRETTLLWDRTTGKPIHNAIIWQDRRTSGICDELRSQGLTEFIREKTGLFIDAYFSATKIKWLLQNVEAAHERAERGELVFGTVDSWLIYNLSGGRYHITDATNASRTMLYNIHSGNWDDEILDLLDIPREILPEVKSSSEIYGETDPGLFGESIPIAGIGGDQQAALFGQMCLEKGMVKNTYGTGGFLVMNTGSSPVPSQNHLLTTVAWTFEDEITYALEGSVFIAGAVVQWLRDGLGLISDSSEVESLAKTVDNNGGVYLVPAFTGLGAPHWDQNARGTLLGITRGTTAGHLARAALESIAFQTLDVLEAMQLDSGIEIPELRVDGGATVNNTLMQFQADISGLPLVRPKISETTALGAAYLAGLAVGFWKNVDEIQDQWTPERRFEPAMSEAERTALVAQWHRAVNRSKGWVKPDRSEKI